MTISWSWEGSGVIWRRRNRWETVLTEIHQAAVLLLHYKSDLFHGLRTAAHQQFELARFDSLLHGRVQILKLFPPHRKCHGARLARLKGDTLEAFEQLHRAGD